MINGLTGDAFSATTLPLCPDCHGNGEKIVRVSRERYSKPRREVEEKKPKTVPYLKVLENLATKGE